MKKITLILSCCFALGITNAQIATFSYTGSLQTWTVPCGVTAATIAANGASGGTGEFGANAGGLGASIISQAITVIPGDIIDIVAGGTGTAGANYGGGGGGGSYVWDATTTTLLVVAGGGGGAGYLSGSTIGGAGQTNIGTLNTPNNAPDGGNAAGGSGGNGGTGGSGTWVAAAGAGWLSNGGNGNGTASGTPIGGFDPANGAAGGAGGSNYPEAGGYGGGGCGDVSGGGGGGYNGGGGGTNGNDPYPAGGGGGSYCISGTPTTTTNSGNGFVVISWVLPTAPVVTASVVSNVSCNGDNNGSTQATVTGGSIPYTYLWTPSAQTNATATGLVANIYTVTVTDACGNTASASATVTQPNILIATATTSSNVTCHGGSNGATASTVTGGTTPYTYSWTGGSTNTTATGLSAGTYTLNVRDMNGCTATASTSITQPNLLVVSSSATANELCHGDSSGSASSSVSGGTMPYTYTWTGGGTKDTAVGLSAGTYTLSVEDANGCMGTASVSITEPTAISATLSSTPDNGSSNGTATVTATGGNLPYTFLWSPGGNTTGSISGKDSGTYCCKVTDANGCIDNACVHIKSIAGIQGISSTNGQITVYPNPNNGQFTIASSISGASTVEIYNILGEKVFTKNLSTTKGTNQINVSNQPNGVYLYRVISESGDLLGQGKITLQK